MRRKFYRRLADGKAGGEKHRRHTQHQAWQRQPWLARYATREGALRPAASPRDNSDGALGLGAARRGGRWRAHAGSSEQRGALFAYTYAHIKSASVLLQAASRLQARPVNQTLGSATGSLSRCIEQLAPPARASNRTNIRDENEQKSGPPVRANGLRTPDQASSRQSQSAKSSVGTDSGRRACTRGVGRGGATCWVRLPGGQRRRHHPPTSCSIARPRRASCHAEASSSAGGR